MGKELAICSISLTPPLRVHAVRTCTYLLTTSADVLKCLVKPAQIPVNPVSLVVKGKLPKLIQEREILFWIFLRLLGNEQHKGEVVHPKSHVVELVDVDKKQCVLESLFSSHKLVHIIPTRRFLYRNIYYNGLAQTTVMA